MTLRYVPAEPATPSPGDPPGFWTTGAIARALEVETHRVTYAIRSRGIPHAGRAGRLRLFDRDGVRRIADALAAAGGRSSAGGGPIGGGA